MNGQVATFPVGFLARVNYALLLEPCPLNFTRQLSKPILESKTGELDLSQYLTPAQLSTYLEKIEWIKHELESLNPKECVQLGFEGSEYHTLGFPKTFDYTYEAGGVAKEAAAGRQFITSIVRKFIGEQKQAAQVVSMGCGDGTLNATYAVVLPEHSRMLLLDLLPSALEIAAHNMSEAWKSRKGIRCDSWEATGADGGFSTFPYNLSALAEGGHLDMLESRSIDLVECTMTAHYVNDIDALFREISRVLRPGPQGRLLFVDRHECVPSEDVPGVKEKGFSEACMFESKPMKLPFHGVMFIRSRTEIVNAMMENGLELIDMRRITPTVAFFMAQAR